MAEPVTMTLLAGAGLYGLYRLWRGPSTTTSVDPVREAAEKIRAFKIAHEA